MGANICLWLGLAGSEGMDPRSAGSLLDHQYRTMSMLFLYSFIPSNQK